MARREEGAVEPLNQPRSGYDLAVRTADQARTDFTAIGDAPGRRLDIESDEFVMAWATAAAATKVQHESRQEQNRLLTIHFKDFP
jgi:hypothetical protein